MERIWNVLFRTSRRSTVGGIRSDRGLVFCLEIYLCAPTGVVGHTSRYFGGSCTHYLTRSAALRIVNYVQLTGRNFTIQGSPGRR